MQKPKTKTVVVEVRTTLSNRDLVLDVQETLKWYGGDMTVTQRPKVLANQPPKPSRQK